MLDKIHWFGHSSFRIDAGKTIYFDPYHLPKAPVQAGIILVSHEHFDHLSPEDIRSICTKDTVISCNKSSAGKISAGKIICKEVKVLSWQQSLSISGIEVSAVPSYNTNKFYHPLSSGHLGFIVTIEGVRVYHAGDTDLIPEMKDIRCDIALLPVGGTYTMTANEAARAALMIKPKIAIPMHYGDGIGSGGQGEEFKELLKGKVKVEILSKED